MELEEIITKLYKNKSCLTFVEFDYAEQFALVNFLHELQHLRQQLQAAEERNAQLRADLAQRDAEGAAYRGALEHYASIKEAYMPIEDSKIMAIVQGEYQMIYGTTAKHALSTSSGKDMLENMRVMQEALEEMVKYFQSEEDIPATFWDKAMQALAKVKGGE